METQQANELISVLKKIEASLNRLAATSQEIVNALRGIQSRVK